MNTQGLNATSRFAKYKTETSKETSTNNSAVYNHIKNVNNFIDYLYGRGNDIIESEIKDLKNRLENGGAPIFGTKVEQLIELGECIEKVYRTYHYNKENTGNTFFA